MIFDDLDLDSDVQCPRYQDAMKSFTMHTLNDKKMSAMIIDVRVVVDAVRMKKKVLALAPSSPPDLISDEDVEGEEDCTARIRDHTSDSLQLRHVRKLQGPAVLCEVAAVFVLL